MMIIIALALAATGMFSSCAASNKAHYRAVHKCDYSGANPVIKDNSNTVKK